MPIAKASTAHIPKVVITQDFHLSQAVRNGKRNIAADVATIANTIDNNRLRYD
jgi:hypothetical protein